MPRTVSRTTGGIAKINVAITEGTAPVLNSITAGIRYTKAGMVCIRSSSGRVSCQMLR